MPPSLQTEAEAAPSPHESGGAQTPCGAQGTVVALCDRGKLCCWPAEASPSGTSGPKPLEIELGGSARIICIEDVGRGRVAAVSECALSRSHLATIHIVDVATGKLLDSSSALDQLSSTILCCASPAPGVVALGTDCGLRFWRERDPARGQWGLVHRTAYSTVGGDIPSNHHLHEALRATTAEFVCAIAAARVPGGRAALATGSGDGTVGLVFPGTGDGEWAHVRDWSARSGADALFRRVRVGRCHDRVCGVADLGRGRLLTADITNTLRVWHCGSGPGAPGSSGAAAPGLLRVLSLDVHRHGADNELESGLLTSSRDGRVAITVGSKCDVQLWRWDHAAETLKQDRAAPTGQSATGIFVAAAPRPPLRPGLGGGGDGPHSEPSSSSAAAAPAPSPGLAVFVGCESGCVERWDVQPGGQSGVLSRIYRPATRTGPVFGVLQVRLRGSAISCSRLRQPAVSVTQSPHIES